MGAEAGNESDAQLPLAGIRVLDLGTFIAAPYAATIMGEFGAEVIKVEMPDEGDPLRAFGSEPNLGDSLVWLSESRNKQSITLRLSDDAGAEILKDLVRVSDVVCESFSPGTLEKWGVGFEDLVEVNPDLVMLRVSGFGQTGPMKDQKGFARIAHAFGGLAHLTGMPDGPPLTPGSTSLADYISGLYGVIGIILALRVRDRVGGQYIDLALYESIFRVLDDLAPAYAKYGTVRNRLGLGTVNACPHGHFKCGDDQWIAVACSSDKLFKRFCHMIGQPELANDSRYAKTENRLRHCDYINGLVTTWASSLGAGEAVALCNRFGIPCSGINTIADIFNEDHIKARKNLISRKDHKGEKYVVPNVIPRLSKTPGRIGSLGPELGSSNPHILNKLLGLSEVEIRDLTEKGVI